MKTRVGDDFIRCVSGGERKRVTIAEAALSYSPLQCWDNSTRGLDSANALEFCRTLRVQADILGTTASLTKLLSCTKVGRFPDLYDKPPGTNRSSWVRKAPRTPDEFAQVWKNSQIRVQLDQSITSYIEQHTFHDKHYYDFLASRQQDQSKNQRSLSPFTLSYWCQVKLTLWRSWLLFLGDPSTTVTMFAMNLLQALIVSSIFYSLQPDSSTISRRGILIFFLVLMNAFSSMLEIMTLYAKRKVVEKHARYALYHPSAEALAAMVCDLPYKVVNCILNNIIIYFMTNLRREPGPFFFFFLLNIFVITLTMSMMFRLMGSLTKIIAQALAPASVILLVIMLYTGYAIKVQNMQNWLAWLRWLNPVHYGFESLMLNEFVGRTFSCAMFIPSGVSYGSISPRQRICAVAGSQPGQDFVDGTTYLDVSYGYANSHRWRNLGIMHAYMVFFLVCHLIATEYVASERFKGEVLVFTRKAMAQRKKAFRADVEATPSRAVVAAQQAQSGPANIKSQTSIFHWPNVCYDVKIGNETRPILDQVDGWVKPGTLTALMGVSGAGKTTLFDALASRITMGVVTGLMLVDGSPRDQSFQRKTGYVTQQDLHLHTSTVREALVFSALLRQPAKYSNAERVAYVDVVIDLLEMHEYSNAIIGTPGEGLNVEQRKRLTIGVKLASRPELLVFLDEPTSGLDSQTSWSICNLMEKLTKAGQAILCTIHQPPAILFQRFDRLLLLAKGGKTVYFGDIGKSSYILTDYFVRNGGPPLPLDANPAEYMLNVIGAAPGVRTYIDWPAVWRASPEYQSVQRELSRLSSSPVQPTKELANSSTDYTEFAASYSLQFKEVVRRAFQQYWRSPSYIYSKAFLSIGAAIFIGLSFLNANNTQSRLQNLMFGVFIFLTVFSQLVDQIMPVFVSQRMMYEARERPAKAYSWTAFLVANIVAMSVFSFLLWYFPMGLYRNARETGTQHSRSTTIFLFTWAFFIFTTSFAFLAIAGLDSAEVAGGIVGLLTIMMFTFCGVVATPDKMPGFWIFMYRCNPFTYFVEGFLGTALANAKATCAANEYLQFEPPNGSTCGDYMMQYIKDRGGFVRDRDDTSLCEFCQLDQTKNFLNGVNINFDNRWRDFGLMWVFVIFNLGAAVFLYWLAHVPKVKKSTSS
ncbi:Multidrug resistance protein [Fusarium odoratissimum]